MTNTDNDKQNTHDTLVRLDPDGRIVVGVFLRNVCKVAWMFKEDYDRICSTYGIRSWRLNETGNGYAYVRMKYNGDNVMLGRLVLGDMYGANVRHKDKDPLNLRKSNLFYGRGRGGDETTRKNRKNKPLAKPLGSGLRIPVVASDV
jgi:hypothetical protein